MSVAELTVDELKALMRGAFEEAMRAPMPDDEGELRPEFAAALRQSLKRSEATMSTGALRARLNLPAGSLRGFSPESPPVGRNTEATLGGVP